MIKLDSKQVFQEWLESVSKSKRIGIALIRIPITIILFPLAAIPMLLWHVYQVFEKGIWSVIKEIFS